MPRLTTTMQPFVDIMDKGVRVRNYVELPIATVNDEVFPMLMDVNDFLPANSATLPDKVEAFIKKFVRSTPEYPITNEVLKEQVAHVLPVLKATCREQFAHCGQFDANNNLLSINLPEAVQKRAKEARRWLQDIDSKLPTIFKNEVEQIPQMVFTDSVHMSRFFSEGNPLGKSHGYSYSFANSPGYDYVFVAAPRAEHIVKTGVFEPSAIAAHELTHVSKIDVKVAAIPGIKDIFTKDSAGIERAKQALDAALFSVTMGGSTAPLLATLRENGLLANEKALPKLPKWQQDLIKDKPAFFHAMQGTENSKTAKALTEYAEGISIVLETCSNMKNDALGAFIVNTGQEGADEIAPVLAYGIMRHGKEAVQQFFPETFEAISGQKIDFVSSGMGTVPR